MQYSAQVGDAQTAGLRRQLEALVQGLGMELIELGVFFAKARKRGTSPHGFSGTVQVRAVVYKPGSLGTTDCSRVHYAILPELELAFPEYELSVEVSTPGITRQVKDGVELAHYRGRGVRLWRTDISDWSAGLLESADEQGITLKTKEGTIQLDYATVAKARLEPSQEEYIGH
jgi:ribosome maturation factor RimP